MEVPKLVAQAIVLFSFSAALAGASDRGGGNAVVCFADSNKTQITSISLFDYWERKNSPEKNEKLDLGEPNLPVGEKIDLALGRLEKLDPKMRDTLKRKAELLLKNLESLLTDEPLGEPRDDNSPMKPEAPCFKVRFALQDKQGIKISRDLYKNQMTDNNTKAGILLHELIYREIRANARVGNSDSSRFFNYLISTNYFLTSSTDEYKSIAENVGLPRLSAPRLVAGKIIYVDTFENRFVRPTEFTFDLSTYKKVVLAPGSGLRLVDNKIVHALAAAGSEATLVIAGQKIETTNRERGIFDLGAEDTMGVYRPHIYNEQIEWEIPAGALELNGVKQPKLTVLAHTREYTKLFHGQDQPFEFRLKDGTHITTEQPFRIDRAGNIKWFHLSASVDLFISGGKKKLPFPARTTLGFDENDNVNTYFWAPTKQYSYWNTKKQYWEDYPEPKPKFRTLPTTNPQYDYDMGDIAHFKDGKILVTLDRLHPLLTVVDSSQYDFKSFKEFLRETIRTAPQYDDDSIYGSITKKECGQKGLETSRWWSFGKPTKKDFKNTTPSGSPKNYWRAQVTAYCHTYDYVDFEPITK